jgi:hypothetical protein
MVERHHVELVPARPRNGRAVQVRERGVRVDLRVARAAEPVRELRGVGIAGAQAWRETTMAPHAFASRAASAKPWPRRMPVIRPAANASPAPSTLSTATRSPAAAGVVPDAFRHVTRDEAAAERAELDDQRGGGASAHALQRRDQVARHAARDHELLLGADQEVELRQQLLQAGGDRGVGHVARLPSPRAARPQSTGR